MPTTTNKNKNKNTIKNKSKITNKNKNFFICLLAQVPMMSFVQAGKGMSQFGIVDDHHNTVDRRTA